MPIYKPRKSKMDEPLFKVLGRAIYLLSIIWSVIFICAPVTWIYLAFPGARSWAFGFGLLGMTGLLLAIVAGRVLESEVYKSRVWLRVLLTGVLAVLPVLVCGPFCGLSFGLLMERP